MSADKLRFKNNCSMIFKDRAKQIFVQIESLMGLQETAQEWSWHTLAESKSAQPTRAVW